MSFEASFSRNFLKFAARTLVNPYCEFTISFGSVGMAKRNIRVEREVLFAVKFPLSV